MTPKKVTIESEQEERRKAACDMIIERAARMMVDEGGASVAAVIDRMLTYAAAQACTVEGSTKTAAKFRVLADRIEAGLFHRMTGEGNDRTRRH
jgi:hypothetical protein